jgi:hypothetical protein
VSFVFPIRGGYQWKRVDQGQDFQTKPGTPLVAVVSGVLTFGNNPSGFGPRYPILKGDDGHTYYYGHVDLPRGLEGKHVGQGDVIAHTQQVSRGNAASLPGWLEFGDVSALGHGRETGGAPIAKVLHQAAGSEKHSLGYRIAQATPIGALIHGDPLTAAKDIGPLGVGNPLKDLTGVNVPTPGDAANSLARDIPGKVLGLLWDALGETAMRMLLYVLFVGGGLAVSYAGVKQLAHQPQAAPA